VKKIFLIVLLAFFILFSAACGAGANKIGEFAKDVVATYVLPETITIEDVTYRNGFYSGTETLWPENLTYDRTETYEKWGSEFHRVTNAEQFNWVYTSNGGSTEGDRGLYCAEDQWEQARAYYADNSNFTYYCRIGTAYSDRDPGIAATPYMDIEKYDALMAFAGENSYDPFDSNKKVQTRRLPFPDKAASPELVFYKQSNDGFFTSYKGNKFFAIDGELFLLYYYDYGHGEYQEMVAVEVPDALGQYFIALLAQLTEA
jgi:hypothetical protein